MLLAFFLIAGMADWVPARWASNDVKSLELLNGTPVNCLLLEERLWSAPFSERAKELGIATLGVVRPGGDATDAARRAAAAKLTGVALEGDFNDADIARAKPAVHLAPRRHIRWSSAAEILGTNQGVWAGVQIQADGAAKAAASGAPWVDTNTGFLRFAHALTNKAFWTANTPPPKTLYPAERYLQAIGDAAMTGARWVLAFDDDFTARLLAREAAALRDWGRMMTLLRFYESHREWNSLQPAGQLALVQDAESGALLSGGILDMIAAKHTPVRPVPIAKLSDERMRGAKMAVNVDPAALSATQKEVLLRFARSGGTTLSGPPGWKSPAAAGDAITLGKEDLDKLDEIWRELNSMTGRKNLGARLFNVSSMLSNLLAKPDGSQVALYLVNYSSYPVEAITVHVLGKFKKCTLYTPESPAQELAVYPIEEGSGVEIERLALGGTLVFE